MSHVACLSIRRSSVHIQLFLRGSRDGDCSLVRVFFSIWIHVILLLTFHWRCSFAYSALSFPRLSFGFTGSKLFYCFLLFHVTSHCFRLTSSIFIVIYASTVYLYTCVLLHAALHNPHFFFYFPCPARLLLLFYSILFSFAHLSGSGRERGWKWPFSVDTK